MKSNHPFPFFFSLYKIQGNWTRLQEKFTVWRENNGHTNAIVQREKKLNNLMGTILTVNGLSSLIRFLSHSELCRRCFLTSDWSAPPCLSRPCQAVLEKLHIAFSHAVIRRSTLESLCLFHPGKATPEGSLLNIRKVMTEECKQKFFNALGIETEPIMNDINNWIKVIICVSYSSVSDYLHLLKYFSCLNFHLMMDISKVASLNQNSMTFLKPLITLLIYCGDEEEREREIIVPSAYRKSDTNSLFLSLPHSWKPSIIPPNLALLINLLNPPNKDEQIGAPP